MMDFVGLWLVVFCVIVGVSLTLDFGMHARLRMRWRICTVLAVLISLFVTMAFHGDTSSAGGLGVAFLAALLLVGLIIIPRRPGLLLKPTCNDD